MSTPTLTKPRRHRVSQARFVAGASRWAHAVDAEEADYAALMQGLAGPVYAPALCGEIVRLCRESPDNSKKLMPYWGPSGTTRPRSSYCELCVWRAAVRTGLLAVDYQVADLAPRGTELAALRVAIERPMLATETAQAVVAAATTTGATRDLSHPEAVELLAHVAAHRPRAVLAAACEAWTCGHDAAAHCPDGVMCCANPDMRIICLACTPDGDMQEKSALMVEAPCQPLTRVADAYTGVKKP